MSPEYAAEWVRKAEADRNMRLMFAIPAPLPE